jgi:molybdopterin-synthase adenylyltransferase
MDDDQLLRYSRHILLPEIEINGQQKLLEGHALIVGAGGLGAPVSLYLAASGVGRLTICDDDDVDLTNLQRQIVHFTDSIGEPKVDSARRTLARINPQTVVDTVAERISGEKL